MPPDLLCFSHLRWDFVFQRPNHLMSRAARQRRVFYVEEPVLSVEAVPTLATRVTDGVIVVTPQVPAHLHAAEVEIALRGLLDELVIAKRIARPLLWYYTPMALPWSEHLASSAVVYDCMDDLAGFRGAPAGLRRLEARLVARADLMFTGGARLHAAKSKGHPSAHCFPSSVDVAHFGQARRHPSEPSDQTAIPRPRLGYAGVIDERIDLDLLRGLAAADPPWNIVLIGPIAKIDEGDIPSAPRIHRLGPRPYQQLPAYLAGWDLGIMPWAQNDATRHISPTKTPEYLAAGLPVVSTSIPDVVEPYGRLGLVHIGDGPEGFIAACRRALSTPLEGHLWNADAFLSTKSWDATWSAMDELVDDVLATPALKHPTRRPSAPVPVIPAPAEVWPSGVSLGLAALPTAE